MNLNNLKTRLTKVVAAVTLFVMIAPLFPPAAFAQDASPVPATGTTPMTQPSDAPVPSSLDFNVNPNGSSQPVVPDTSAPSNEPAVSPTVDAPLAPSLSPETPT